MEMITMILSGLALLAASVCLILLVQEKKRNQKRNIALIRLIETECKKIKLEDYEQRKKICERIREIDADVADMKKGIVPDYNEAIAAKQAVDDFNMGISAILNFDPLAAMKKSREEQEAR